jgi:hypothetical protein
VDALFLLPACLLWLQGSARVIRCLQDHRRSLTPTCAAALFDHEVSAAGWRADSPMQTCAGFELYCTHLGRRHLLMSVLRAGWPRSIFWV